MNKLEVSSLETLIIQTFFTYKFLTAKQLSNILKNDISEDFLQNMQDKLLLKALRNRGFTTPLESIYFAIPNKNLHFEHEDYFEDIDLRKLSISQEDYFHIFYTVNYHIIFASYSEFKHININYFSAYFDNFKNKTKKNELEASGKFILNSDDYLIPNATMNFSTLSGEEYIYALDLFHENELENVVGRISKYITILIENNYKLDRVIVIFKDETTKNKALEFLQEANIIQSHEKNFIFKTIENLDSDISLQWMLAKNKPQEPKQIEQKQEATSEEIIDIQIENETPVEETIDEAFKVEETPEDVVLEEVQETEQVESSIKIADEIVTKEPSSEQIAQEEEELENKSEETPQEIINENESLTEEDTPKPIISDALKKSFMELVESSALTIYLFAGIAAFVVSAYMEMIAFDSFYPGFFLISVVMVIAFEVAKVGSIFMKVYIKNSGSEVNKWTLKVLGTLFIPLLFGLSIISSMAVTADKLESPHAEELKAKSITKIQTEYDEIVALTEKDHLRRTKQLKQDFFEKIAEFESRKKEVIADKDAEIEKQKTVYGADGKTWKGSKYEEHIKERKNLITEFAAERMRLEHLYNDQIEQESAQYRQEKKEDLSYKTENLQSAESEVLADSWQAQNEMVRSFIKVVNHGFHLKLKELDFIFMLSILISILLELTIYKVFSNYALVYSLRKEKRSLKS